MQYSIDLEKIEFKFFVKETTNRLEISSVSGQHSSQDIDGKMRYEIISILHYNTNFYLDFSGKQDNDTLIEAGKIADDCKIELENLWINDILIEKWALQDMCFFEPCYSESARQYAEQSGINLPSRLFNQWTFWANGRLFFGLDNFFQRYNQKLIESLNQFNSWVSASHLGMIEDHKKQECKILIDQINNFKKS